MNEGLLGGLNEPQREAVEYTDGPLMIIAGAGSGKTRVLTYRIAYLIANGAEPFNILSLTFTNKAAREMRTRIETLIGSEARNIWMGTFHSVFAKILRFEGNRLGYQSNFTIYDSDDSKSLIKQVVKELELDDKLYKPNAVLSRISNAKNNLISWRAYQNSPELIQEDEDASRPKIAEIYKRYSLKAFQANAMDFDDLLFNTNVLFAQHIDVLNKYQQKFQHVLIDEFQDTNMSQYGIVRKLAAVHQNISVVGDDAQSIYAFRGANIQNILNFEKDYPDLKVVRLEQNYRSTQTIVEAANSIIKHNTSQLEKKVWTSNDLGTPINLISASSDNEEGRLIAMDIFEKKRNGTLPNRDFAILYRTNSQSRAMEEALRRLNIPYKIIGGLSFYQRKEIKDLIGYLRFLVNPQDTEAFRRIINLPKRGIGPGTVDKLMVAAAEQQMPIWEVLCNARQLFGGNRFVKAIEGFVNLIKTAKQVMETKDAYDTASYIASQSGLVKELYDDKTIEGKARYENIQELLNAVKEFVVDPEHEDHSLETFLQDVALVSSADKEVGDDVVTMMTIHMSKGLEFPYVYIVGLEENLFPSQMMLESRKDLEEERRLFYVAATRAEKVLTLSFANQRYRFGKLIMCEPSRFIQEIDSRYLRTVENQLNMRTPDFSNAPSKDFKSQFVTKTNPARPRTASAQHTVSANFVASPASAITEGVRVEHKKFGFGEVKNLEIYGNDKRVKINFEKSGEKTLILSFAKLMVLEEN